MPWASALPRKPRTQRSNPLLVAATRTTCPEDSRPAGRSTGRRLRARPSGAVAALAAVALTATSSTGTTGRGCGLSEVSSGDAPAGRPITAPAKAATRTWICIARPRVCCPVIIFTDDSAIAAESKETCVAAARIRRSPLAAAGCGSAPAALHLALDLVSLALGLDLLAPRRLAAPAPARGTARQALALDADQFQRDAATDRHHLGNLHGDPLAQLDGQPRIRAHQCARIAVEMEKLAPQAAHRDQPVGAGLIQPHEGPELGDAADATGEFLAHAF